jgi:hypothetical protein
MYKNYVKNSLSLNDYNKILKEAPEDHHYCNAICQKFLKNEEFFQDVRKGCCKICFYQIEKARKLIDSNKLTAEKFKENPSIVTREKTIIPLNRTCKTCNVEKTLENFESSRKECMICRRKRTKQNHKDKFDEHIIAIDEIKKDIDALTKLIRSMPKDLIALCMTHYKISRSHTDNKDQLVVKIIEHFKKLSNPFACTGFCGSINEQQFSLCDDCKNNNINLIEQKNVEFQKEIDEHVKNLTYINKEDEYKYTKKQVIMIAKRLGVVFYRTQDKPVIIEIINKYFENKKNEENKKSENIETISNEITLNEITVFAREDGYINATLLCKAGNKKFNNWYRMERTTQFIDKLSRSALISADLLIDIINTGPNEKRGTWVHPRVAVSIAQWISPDFDVKVSGWVYQLAVTGNVQIGNEKTDKQIIEEQNKLLKEQELKIKDQDKKYQKLLYKRQYHKFKKGPIFYIFETDKNVFKIGFDNEDINVRLEHHRTTYPNLKLYYLCYTPHASLLESNMLIRFNDKKMMLNHEIITDMTIDKLIDSANTFINFCNFPYTIEVQEEIDKYND